MCCAACDKREQCAIFAATVLVQVLNVLMVEKPKPADAPSNLSIIGRYILQPGVFDYLGRQKRTVGGEIQLTDSMAELLGQEPFHGIRYEGRRFDCGSKGGFLKANVAFGLERAELRDDLREFLKDPDRAS